jgi:tRNA (guanine-N7-)-methyltransferase
MTDEPIFDIKPEFKDKSIRSFVIRSGRMTEGQRAALKTLWPKFGLSLYDGAINYQALFNNNNPVVIEIGFGMGDSLIEMAETHRDTNFIGIEVHPPGVGRLINEADERNLSNIKVFCADANDVLEDCINDASLSRVQLYFPDPWHKKKHHKRRIVQPEFIDKIRRKLEVGGVFHMATDWEPYAEHMMENMAEEHGFTNVAGANLFSPRPDYRPITKFEKRGERLGHGVWDLLFQKD